MDIKNNSGVTVGNNLYNNQESNNIRPSYSSVVSNTHIKRNNKNIRQLQHELLNSKTKLDNSISSPSDIIHNNIKSEKSKKPIDNSLTPSTTSVSINNEKGNKNNGNNNNPSLKIITNNIKNKDQKNQNSNEMKSSVLTSVEDILSPIEKVKVDDCYINSIPTPATTPPIPSNTVSLTDVSSSSVSILSPTSPTLTLNSNANLTNSYVINELSYSLKEKIQTELLKVYNGIQPTEKSHQNHLILLEKIQNIFDNEFPGKIIKAHLFGSSVNGLATVYSDVDICLTTPSKEENYGLNRMDNIATILEKYNMTEIYTIQEAKVPICRFVDPETKLSCDINVNNTIALQNTLMVQTYASIDERAKQLIILIKHYAKRRMINDAKGGTLSSYCWVNMVIHFLQQRIPPILPCLHELSKDCPEEEKVYLDNVDCTFYHDLEQLKDFGKDNKETLTDLFYGFFKLYGEDFNYKKHVVSVRKGIYMLKSEKGWNLDDKKTKLRNNYFCVEEPFNPTRNLANSADRSSINGIRDEFLIALNALRKDGDVEKVFEQYRPFRRQFNPYSYSFNAGTNYSNVNNNSNYGYPMTNSSNPLSPTLIYTPVFLPTNYQNYNQYTYPVYLLPPQTNLMYSYNSGGEEDNQLHTNNSSYTNSYKFSKYDKRKKYMGKKYNKINSGNYEKEPLSPRSKYMDNNNNNKNYYSTYPNNVNNNINNINGYDRFSNSKLNYSVTSPKVLLSSPTLMSIPYSYNSPILSPASSFSSLCSMSSASMPNLLNEINNYHSINLNTLFNKQSHDNDNDNKNENKNENDNENNNDNKNENENENENKNKNKNENENDNENGNKNGNENGNGNNNDNDNDSDNENQIENENENENGNEVDNNNVPLDVLQSNDEDLSNNDNKFYNHEMNDTLNNKYSNISNTKTNNNTTNNYSIPNNYRIPVTNNLMFSYSSPMFNQLNNNIPNDSPGNESFSFFSHYTNNSFSSTSISSSIDNLFDVDENYQKQHFLSSSPLIPGQQTDNEINGISEINEVSESGKDNICLNNSKDFILSHMNHSISSDKKNRSSSKKLINTNINSTPSETSLNSIKEENEVKVEEEVILEPKKKSIRKVSLASSTATSDSDKLSLITGASLTSPSISILSSSSRRKLNSTVKSIPSGFDSIKYPSILNINREEQFVESTSLLSSTSENVEATEGSTKKKKHRNRKKKAKTSNPEDVSASNTEKEQNNKDKTSEKDNDKFKEKTKKKENNTNNQNQDKEEKSNEKEKRTKNKDKDKKATVDLTNSNCNKNTDLLIKSINALLKVSESSNNISDNDSTSENSISSKRRGRSGKRSNGSRSSSINPNSSILSNQSILSTTSTTSNTKSKKVADESTTIKGKDENDPSSTRKSRSRKKKKEIVVKEEEKEEKGKDIKENIKEVKKNIKENVREEKKNVKEEKKNVKEEKKNVKEEKKIMKEEKKNVKENVKEKEIVKVEEEEKNVKREKGNKKKDEKRMKKEEKGKGKENIKEEEKEENMKKEENNVKETNGRKKNENKGESKSEKDNNNEIKNDNNNENKNENNEESSAVTKKARKSQAKKARDSIRELSKTAFEKPRTVNDILNIFKSANISSLKKEEPIKEESIKKEPISYAKMLSKNIQQSQNKPVEIAHKVLMVPSKEEKNL